MTMSQKTLGRFFGPPTLVDMLRHRVACQPDNIAFTFLTDGEQQQENLTYRQLDRQARAIGAWLELSGLSGQRALLCYPPSLEFIAAFFGCLYANVVAVPLYPPRRNQLLSRIETIARCAEATVALTTEPVLHRIQAIMEPSSVLSDMTWLATSHVPEGVEKLWEPPEVDGETLAFLQYTSGSTGKPKGVMLTHRNLIHNSALIAHVFEHTRSGLGVFWLPSYHDMGLIGGILQPLYVGRPNVMMSPMAFLQKPVRWLAAITRFRGTTSGGPNFAYDLCVRRITPEQRRKLDLSSWRVAFNGAEPIRPETLERFIEVFQPCGFRPEAFYPCYGLAEATLIVSGGYVKEPAKIMSFDKEALAQGRVAEVSGPDDRVRRLVGCGQTMPDQQIVIADPETLTRCPEGQVGEIWVSGPSVAQGYWNQPGVTEATFRAHLKDSGEGPFLRTGDLGFLRNGELFVTGRIKDVIIVRGVNHYPQDIEATVEASHPRLRPGCGAAFTVEANGEEKLVFVQELERRSHGDPTPVFQAIVRAVQAEHDLVPDTIVLIRANSIPKTSSGKIQRYACRQAFLDGSLRVMAVWEGGRTRSVHRHLRQERAEATAATPTTTARATAASPRRPTVGGEAGRSERQPAATPAASQPLGLSPDGPDCLAPVRLSIPRDEDALAREVQEEVVKVAKERAAGLTIDSSLLEIGLDSIERMEIVAAVEDRFGGRIPEDVLFELYTCRDVARAVIQFMGDDETAENQPDNSGFTVDGEIPPAYYQVSEFPESVRLRQQLAVFDGPGLKNPFFQLHDGILGSRTVIDGRQLINYAGYNYLRMSGDPEVAQAAKDAVDRYGTSVSASRLVSGENELHRHLEREITALYGTEDAVIFSAGHHTNETVIGHLFGPKDLILHDALAHNSIQQGAKLSGARKRAFAHNDWRNLDELLSRLRRRYRRVLIAIEGVYSMDGDFPDLPKFIEVKNRHKALLMVDEAHSLGTMGRRGFGIADHFGIDTSQVEIWMGTLSKALGSCGGFITGSKDLVQYLKYTAPGFVFSCGIPPASTGAALAAIRLLRREPERVERLRRRSALFLRLARQRGMDTGSSDGTPVIPIILGNSMHCVQLAQALLKRGINARPILHPAVEERASRLRFFINADHTEDQIRYTVDVLAEELAKLDPAYLGHRSTDAPLHAEAG
ncbi:MAG TPA: aminotransferase class I/II-fold pyridoxal phosphate-dependent enzyme [Planctomycetaceae bacterium]|nr:aminotransferase class I/II-fold pyridoxal phosphate-dependent enzyme [Planctomycetaceae bacterium]